MVVVVLLLLFRYLISLRLSVLLALLGLSHELLAEKLQVEHLVKHTFSCTHDIVFVHSSSSSSVFPVYGEFPPLPPSRLLLLLRAPRDAPRASTEAAAGHEIDSSSSSREEPGRNEDEKREGNESNRKYIYI